jgi:thiol-disulfide isomerase/thioredoxin
LLITAFNQSDQKTVLYFWIANCGYCIEAVPKLNRWMKQYSPKNIDIIGINAYDAKPVIDHFSKKYNPTYPTLYQGADVARQYGINGFPSVVIVQKGKILYNGGVDEEKIKSILNKH